jgi:hypothetical protein
MITYYTKQYQEARFVGLEYRLHRHLHTCLDPIEVYHHTTPIHAWFILITLKLYLRFLDEFILLYPTCFSQTFDVIIWFFSSLKNKNPKFYLTKTNIQHLPHQVIVLIEDPNTQLIFHYYFLLVELIYYMNVL